MTDFSAAAPADPAQNEFFTALYEELRKLARSRLRRRDTPTLLDTTSLVHESYLRFLRISRIQIDDRAHFLGYAARVMRSVIVDYARQRAAMRRGGVEVRVQLDTGVIAVGSRNELEREVEILRVHEALEDLAAIEDRLARVVEMRYFAGMREQDIAEVLGLTERTVRRDWEKARMILAASLK